MFELYTYGGGDFLRQIFNGVALIFGDDNYYGALKSAALLGFIGVLIYAAFQKGPLDIKWILGIVMVVMILVVPKVNVTITDRVIPANSAVVSNIPLGLGFTATGFSKLGDWLTRSFETVFSLPNQVKYSGNGLLFASHLVEASTRFEMTTPRIANNFNDFWSSCVYFDLLLELYKWDELAKATDIMSFLGGHTSIIRSFTYQPASGDSQIINCRDGLNSQLKADLEAEVETSTHIRGVRLGSTVESQTAAVSRFASAMPMSYQYLTGISMTNAKILSQNVLANSFKRGLSSFAGQVDAVAASQDFAMARAEQERRNTFAVMGKLAKRMLPIMHSLFEAFIYAIFPIIMLLAMLPVAGKVLMGYAKALFWINMWPPLYAVLHFAMMYYSQVGAKGAVVQPGSGYPAGLSMMTNTGLGEVLSDYAAIAGYLSLSIPMIAYMLVSQSGAMMASLAGRMMQSYDNPVSKASDEVTSGNIQMGNLKYMTEHAFQANAAPSDQRGGITAGDGIGNQTRTSDSGGGVSQFDVATSQLGMEMSVGKNLVSSATQSVTEATSAAEKTEVSLAQSNAALRSEIDSTMNRLDQSETAGATLSSTAQKTYQEATQNTDSVLEKLSEQYGVEVTSVKGLAGNLGISGEKDLAKLFDTKVSGGVGINLGGQQIDKDTFSKALDVLSSEEYTQALRAEGIAAEALARQSQVSDQDSFETGLSASLTQQEQASSSHSIALGEMQSAVKSLDRAEQLSSTLTAKADDGFISWLQSEKGLGDDQIQQLYIDATNDGRASPAHQHLYNYAEEYQQDVLQEYTQNPVSLENLQDGNFNGGTNVFGAVDDAANQIASGAGRNMAALGDSGAGQVAAQGASHQGEVLVESGGLGDKVASELTDTEAQVNQDQANPESLVPPDPKIEEAKNDLNQTQLKQEDKINDEMDKTAIGRLADATVGRLTESISGWFK